MSKKGLFSEDNQRLNFYVTIEKLLAATGGFYANSNILWGVVIGGDI